LAIPVYDTYGTLTAAINVSHVSHVSALLADLTLGWEHTILAAARKAAALIEAELGAQPASPERSHRSKAAQLT
jgi:transcriptional regulator of acetoin/glycerol metabolism